MEDNEKLVLIIISAYNEAKKIKFYSIFSEIYQSIIRRMKNGIK